MKKCKLILVVLLSMAFLGTAFAQELPTRPADNPEIVKRLETVRNSPKVKAFMAEWVTPERAQERFDLIIEITRIEAPSNEELFRARAVAQLFTYYIDTYKDKTDAGRNARLVYDFDGYMEGAGIQIIDGRPVYSVCMEIKGTYSGDVVPRPKVLFEGHIDSVNPDKLPGSPRLNESFTPVYIQNVNDPVATTREDMAKLQQLNFDGRGNVVKDDLYNLVNKRWNTLNEAKANNGYRMYIPSIGDMMIQTISVIKTAELVLKHDIRPYYDLWICGSAGEEGRGNLRGMKQWYGYNQDATENGVTGIGNNALNFVTNVSAEGGNVGAINYLGSHRYEIAYVGPGGSAADFNKVPNSASAAARAMACIADLKTPSEDGTSPVRTTYTVGIAYGKTSDANVIAKDVSIEVDMRSNDPKNVDIMDAKMQICFKKGVDDENAKYGLSANSANAVKMEQRWYGDRPAYSLTAEKINSDPLIAASFFSLEMVDPNTPIVLSTGASSVNSNVPAKMGVPTINITYGCPGGFTGQGHSYNEWGTICSVDREAIFVERGLIFLLTMTGFESVPPAYGPVGARTTTTIWK